MKPVIPSVQLMGQNTEHALAYVKNPDNRVKALTPRETWDAVHLLRAERPNYDSIRADPRNLATDESVIKEAAAQLDSHIWKNYGFWMLVLADRTSTGQMELTFADGTKTEAPIQSQNGQLSADIAKALGLDANANVYHYPDSDGYEKTRALYLVFRDVHEWPILVSYGGQEYRVPYWGVLLGSVVNPRAEAQQELDRLYKEQTELSKAQKTLGMKINKLEAEIPSLPEAE